MTPPTAAPTTARIKPMQQAMERGDLEAADAALAALANGGGPTALPAEAWAVAGELHLRRHRWADAARLLGRIIEPDAVTAARLKLARNFVALATHRPRLCAQLAETLDHHAGASTYRIAGTPSGAPTIVWQAAGTQAVSLSPQNDPRRSVAQSLAQLAEAVDRKLCIGLHGLGDGYLLAALAERGEPNSLGQRQCVHVIVDDAAHMLAAMRLHDYSGPRGPIAQGRFMFHVGGDWADRFRRVFAEEPMTPFPQTQAAQGPQGAAIGPVVARIGAELAAGAQRLGEANHACYAGLSLDALVDVFGPTPSRPPRVLAITSRFTTVLQHSTRDAVDAFERAGWRAMVLIEPTEHHQLTPLSVCRAVEAFKPDLVFIIDHLRYEYGDRFPPQLPMICWIQDHLPNLTSRRAGASITKRDYVLTAIAPRYARQQGYPARQMIDVPKLTRVPVRPTSWSSSGDDLVYVSNASADDAELIAMTERAVGEHGELRRFVGECCRWMIALYERGESLAGFTDVRRVVEATEQQMRMPLDAAVRSQVIQLLHHPLNNALYRRQALRWARDVATERGLTLAIFGNGWERSEEFAALARGPVAYGASLEELTRRSKINLQIVPYFCVHQRLLDGLVAGGFFLVREHPFDRLMGEVAAYLDAHVDASVGGVDEAMRAIDPARQVELGELLRRAATLGDLGERVDVIEQVRCAQRAGHVGAGGLVLPRLGEVSFTDAGSLRRCVERFIDDPQARAAIADEQRRSVEARLTYTAGMGRVVREMHQLLVDERNGRENAGRRPAAK